MKKLLFLFFVSLYFLTPSVVDAKVIFSEKNVTIPADEVIDDDVFVAGESISILGTVNGDVYAAAGTINIAGQITGDVLAAGGTIIINDADIGDDLRVAGGNLTLTNTTVGDNVNTFGGNISVIGDNSNSGSFVFGGGNVQMENNTGRNLLGGGGMINLNSIIGKEALLGGGVLNLGPKTTINGDLTYSTDEEIQIDPQAQIVGQTIQHQPKVDTAEIEAQVIKAGKGINFGLTIWGLLSNILLGSVIIYLLPKTWRELVKTLSKKTVNSLGYGLLAVMVIIPLLLVSLISIIGIKLGFVATGLIFQGLMLAKFVVASALGGYLFTLINRKPKSAHIAMAVGLTSLAILSQVPVLNIFTGLFTGLAGLGALILYSTKLVQSQRK